MKKAVLFTLAGLLLLAGCTSPGAIDESITPESTEVGTRPPADDATFVIYGRTAEGAYFHGAENAPVTLIDYSDFL